MEPKPDVQLYGTSGLCFDKDLFMRNDFNVDDFMREYQCSGDANLETLRDDLGIYLKILRSAMIDLINRDYADFVNLSTNLTGLDSLIQALTIPLGQLRLEVLSVHQLLEGASTGVLSDLEQQRMLELYKRKLATLSDIAKRLDNLEELLNQSGLDSDVLPLKKTPASDSVHNHPGGDEKRQDSAGRASSVETGASVSSVEADLGNLCLAVCTPEELLDRFAAELSYLNYLAKSCEGTKLMSIYRPRLSRIQSAVETAIERNLRTGLGFPASSADSPSADASSAAVDGSLLRRTLIACAVMDAETVAEGVVREMLAPKIKEVVNESALRSNPRGLGGVLSSLLALLHARLEPLLALTAPRRLNNSASSEEVAGFRFVERAVFPEVTAALASLTDFYSPANPTAFHQRYLQCMEFIDNVERLLVTRQRVDDFRALASYQKFMDEWNLAVYFQIRNQEIGQGVESSLCEENGLKLYLNEAADSQSSSYAAGDHNSDQTVTGGASEARAVLGSTRGVMRGVLQSWLPEVFLPPLLHRFWKLTLLVFARHRTWLTDTIATMQRGDLKSLYGSLSSLSSFKPPASGAVGQRAQPQRPSVVELAVYLLSDLALLQDRITGLYDTSIVEHLQHAQVEHQNMIRATLSSESGKLSSCRESLLSLVSRDVASAMTSALQPVTDTPRLYRRTNRSAPRQPQQYVSAVMAPLQRLHDTATARLAPAHTRQCYATVCAAVAQQYYSLTSEVLANVSKTEESLRRLKRARGNTAVASPQAQGLTDEDKIRDQLHLDVQAFGDQLRGLGVVTEEVAEFVKLSEAVRDARTATTAATAQ